MTTRQRLTIVATGLGMFMVFLDALIVNVALPEIQSDFGVGESGAQAVVTAYSVGMAVTIMWSATLADLRGRRRVYIAAAIIFCAASVLCGLAPNFDLLVVGRTVQGLAAGPITVASLALLSAAFTDDTKRARAVGLWTGIAAIGTALGPTLGGILSDAFGWRSVFLVNVPVGVVLVLLTLSVVEESRDPSERTFDYGGQVAFGIGVATFAAAIIAAPRQGWLSPLVVVLFGIAVISMGIFVRRERRIADPMMDLELFNDGLYSLSIATMFVFFFMGYGMLLIVTQYFQNVRGYSALEAGLLILPFSLGFVTMAPNAARVSRRIGRRTAIILATVGEAVGLTIVAIGLSYEPWVVGVGMLIVSLCNALAIVPLTALSMSTVTPDKSGMASGIMGTQRALGSTTGYAVMGSILALWVGRSLDNRLTTVVPDAGERDEISTLIVDQANPSAFIAEIGPSQPLGVVDATEESEILQIADDVFITGMQVSLGVGVTILVVTLIALLTRFPADEPADV
ncbi:MAG: MFS transporter [Acidimicrobiia bacterium]|nr:MFS transporter [Acidimicrobiia bacterium]